MEQVSFPPNKEEETVTSHQTKAATDTLFPDSHKQAGLFLLRPRGTGWWGSSCVAVHGPSLFLTARQILDGKVTELEGKPQTPLLPTSWVSSLTLRTKQDR